MTFKFNVFRGISILIIALMMRAELISYTSVGYVFLAETLIASLAVMAIKRDKVNAYFDIFVAIASIICMAVVFFETYDKVPWYQNFILHKFWTGIQFFYLLLFVIEIKKASKQHAYLAMIICVGALVLAVYVGFNNGINSSNKHIYYPMILTAACYLAMSFICKPNKSISNKNLIYVDKNEK